MTYPCRRTVTARTAPTVAGPGDSMDVAYEDDHVLLICGDFRDMLGDLGSFDAVVTDPPYGETSLTWDRWPPGWPALLTCVTASMWMFGSMRMFIDRSAEFTDWKLSQDVVWQKHNGSGFHTDRFRRVHEHALHWYRGAWRDRYHEAQTTNDATARTIRHKARPPHTGGVVGSNYVAHDGGPRLRTSVIEAPSMHGRAIHPTEKPVDVLDPLIRYAVPAGGMILDPFAGSGSTLAAARAAGRRAIGVEINPEYAHRAAVRLAAQPVEQAASG
jgi:site-specific DNA-methyltransferase (adenine-specific)